MLFLHLDFVYFVFGKLLNLMNIVPICYCVGVCFCKPSHIKVKDGKTIDY